MFVSRTTVGWEALAPAKLNLYLDVLGRRADGFHELEMLMCPVRLFDQLRWTSNDRAEIHFTEGESTERFRFSVAGTDVPSDETNLAMKAAHLLAAEAGVEPYGSLSLTKRIPTQAGMGGGSSDAAATLQLLNQAWGVNYSKQRLTGLAAQLGSDVPFFFAGGPAVCRGRGEILQPQSGLPKLHFVVVKPDESISTKEAFMQLNAGQFDPQKSEGREKPLERLLELLRNGMLTAAAKAMSNSFQSVILASQPILASLQAQMTALNSWGATMTGSGSAFFGLCGTAQQARHLAGKLRAVLEDGSRAGAKHEFGEGHYLRGKTPRTHGTVWTTSTCY
ncbi:4-(cytidine 5'-diphospho)-2-C-methyl-D-erythritol kinase [Adhaeretor mobilis]|uniref:4-diphosphocytidyl-2-C-methyl-D-erythritol kinase n=1 Tax=Adhaeretor mobilis TaxID=1930276 RepID=A0A517MRD5_9BACT|nr:4-(cytidine 5'-diphospho)-2-C-methyl-D-erythritol kinase [Adhaeretor mobilis]QDS97438.1 4-diphosphocytidyl-2-C-methyl-D-erythritol kinase [Adhaeretor mobilis]